MNIRIFFCCWLSVATAEVRARSYTADGRASRVKRMSFRKMAPLPAVKIKKTDPGLAMQYFEGIWKKLPDFTKLTPMKKGIVKQANLSETGHRPDEFALVLDGYVEIATTGVQTFYLNSDDGSKLYIDGKLVVDHDGDHSAIKKSGQIMHGSGKHTIRIEYMERKGSQFLQAGMIDAAGVAAPFTPFQLSH